MVREEYLNPEFMYKFINFLCKADGWTMYFFAFGKLTYQNFKQPILMQNGHGYNMVYKFQVYKLRNNVNYGKRKIWRDKEVISVSSSNLTENIICKDIYFDILNECFVEHDDTVLSFEEFPSFFRLDNQLYYGIYGQPKVLKYHYSKARDCYNLEEYMHKMDINSHNLFDPHSLLCNMINKENRIDNYFSDEAWKFYFETQDEANSAIREVLNKNYKPCDCKKFYKIEKNFRTKLFSQDGYFKLHIHKPEFPIFYTDNVLELTSPIIEAVKELGSKVACTLYSIQDTITLLVGSMGQLMAERLHDRYELAFEDELRSMYGTFKHHPVPLTVEKECHRAARRCTRADREKHSNLSTELGDLHSLTSENISQIKDCYEALYSNIKKIKASDISLNTLLEISNNFKMLESKTSTIA